MASIDKLYAYQEDCQCRTLLLLFHGHESMFASGRRGFSFAETDGSEERAERIRLVAIFLHERLENRATERTKR